MKTMDKTDKCFLAFFFLMFFISGFVVSQGIGTRRFDDFIIKQIKDVPNSEEEIILDCQDKDLEDTCRCLRDNVLMIYNYTIRDDTEKTFQDVKQNGGDCYDYSILYKRLAKELGFNADTRKYDWEQNVFPGHRMAFIWDDTQYCRLDLLKVYCKKRLDNDG